jgi:hypothetical protein
MPAVPFISWVGHGAASLSPPGVFTDAVMYMFAIAADIAAMQRLTDALLNEAAGNALRYRVAAPAALLTFVDVARCTSAIDAIGWLPGRECAIWVPLIEQAPGNPFHFRPVLWAPYIFIDYDIGMLTGREAWGWPKVGARIGIAPIAANDAPFVCTTTYFRNFAADAPGMTAPLYRILRAGPPCSDSRGGWRGGTEAARAIAQNLLTGVRELTAELGKKLIQSIGPEPIIPSVCLKQLRDSAVPGHACYRAIVDSPVRITQFYDGGMIATPLELEITTCRSHQIVADFLGRNPDPDKTTMPIRCAAWVRVDFQALPGKVLAAAG